MPSVFRFKALTFDGGLGALVAFWDVVGSYWFEILVDQCCLPFRKLVPNQMSLLLTT